jgi:2-polyprenyl-3-methyl-5-hydroxy-6-metoxy-1,4-benzoquinol methylase
MDVERVDCNLCHADDTEPLFEGRDRLHGLPGVFPVVRCRRCGLVYLNPRPTKEEIATYYPQSYEPHVFFERVRHSPVARLDYYYGLRKRRRAIERLSRAGRLLDVGCGSGSFLYYMREHGWQVSGQEISQSAADYARRELGLDIHLGELEHTDIPGDTYDVVTLWNVLEHLHDPAGSLARVKELMQPDGLLVIAVPNLKSWDAQLFGPTWVGYDVPRHLYTFSTATLEALLRKAGFGIVYSRCLFGSYQAIADSLKFLLHRRKQQENALQSVVERITGWRLVRLLAAPFLRVADGLEKGSVMTVFCRARRGASDQGDEVL